MEPTNPKPEPAPALNAIELKPRHPTDSVMTWCGSMTLHGRAMVPAVLMHQGGNALAHCPDLPTAQYIAARLARAAWLEACLLDMSEQFVALNNDGDAKGREAAVTAASLVRNLAKVWNGPEAPPPASPIVRH